MYAIISASNSLYKIEETNIIKDRLRSIIILLVIIILLLFLILVPMLGEQILELLRNSKPFTGIIDEMIMIYNIIKAYNIYNNILKYKINISNSSI